ncbi:MAG: hypothetical protein GY851_06660, partial [bacterium]|nr:hypothetical protein [bacterium]
MTERHAYERGEVCTLRMAAPGADAVEFDIGGWLPFRAEVTEGVAEYAVDTSVLRAQDYTVRARLFSDGEAGATVTFPLSIGARHDDERLPVWRWGYPNPDWWGKRGFTGGWVSARRDPASMSRPLDLQRQFDKATRHDFELGFYIYPLLSHKWKGEMESVGSLRPDGTRHEKPCPLEPEVMAHAKATVDSWVGALADYPGLRHVMLQSEWQQPYCVNEVVAELCKEETGLDIREFITEKGNLKGFDASTIKDGVIDDDHPHYRFLQWWWQRGHGTVMMNEMMHEVVKSHRPDLMTWHEPYRLAPVRHSHKSLDCIGTWTYGYPDIKRLCYTTYLQAAARSEGQLVQQDITLFVYGRFAIPLDESTADYGNDFSGKDPFFTAGPDYAREAMWLVLSQRPDILCFYSAGKFSPDKPGQDPHYIAPETFDAIGEVCEYLVKPYGPTILACERVQPEVAVLMSAASTWMRVSPRLPGYPTERTLPFASLLMMNHVPFDVVLDEDVAEGALANYTMLVMPRADTLTRTMHAQITEFAGNGGAVIADASLRAEIPGAKMTQYDMTHQNRINGKDLAKGEAVTAEEDRAIMEGYAKELEPLLASVARPADSMN